MSSDQEQASEDALRVPDEETNSKTNGNAKRFRLRSLLRFRLSYLLILITIIAVLLGTVVREARNEVKVLELWEGEPGLLLSSYYELNDLPENVESYPKWYREVFSGMLLQNIEWIILENEDFEFLDDEQMSKVFRTLPLAVNLQRFSWLDGVPTNQLIVGLSMLTKLRELEFSYAELEPEAFTGIYRLKSLKRLDLENTKFEGKDVFSLRNFPVLEVLHLRRTRISDSVVQQLCDLPLKRLNLSRNNLTPAAFTRLSQLDELEELQLVGLEVDLQTCEQISQLKNLRELDLSRSTISDAGVRILCESLSSLERLSLDYCQQLSDASIEPLSRLTTLRNLSLYGCDLTPEGVDPMAQSDLESLWLPPDALSVKMVDRYRGIDLVAGFWIREGFVGSHHLEMAAPDLSREVLRALLLRNSLVSLTSKQTQIQASDLRALVHPAALSFQDSDINDTFFDWLNTNQDLLTSLELRNNAITAQGLLKWNLPADLIELIVRGVTFPRVKLQELSELKGLQEVEFESEPDFEILLQFLSRLESDQDKLGLGTIDSSDMSLRNLGWFRPATGNASKSCSQRKPCTYFRFESAQSNSGAVVEVDGTKFSKQQLQQILALFDIERLVISSPLPEHLELFSSPNFESIDLRLIDVSPRVLDAGNVSDLSVHSLEIHVPECPMRRLAAFVEKLPERIALDLECFPNDLKLELPSVVSLLNRPTAKVLVHLEDAEELTLLANSDAQDWGDDCHVAGTTMELKRLRDWMSGQPYEKNTTSLVLTPNLGTKEQLAGLRDLKSLDQICWIGDDSSTVPEEIFACQHLDYLTLSNCQVSGTLVRKIALLQSVLGLVFHNCEFDSEAYRELSELHLLESISFENCKLQPDELRNFTPPRGLEAVYFDNGDIDPGCIPIIETWTSLSQCVPVDCNLSRAQMRRVYRR